MKCPTCGEEKKTYYGRWCPKCDKPKVETLKHLNFIQCLEHLEANGHTDIKERMWDYCSHSIKNDTSFTLLLKLDVDEDDIDPQAIADLTLIRQTWNIQEDSIVMDVSW